MSNEVPFFSQTAILERYIRSSNPGENPSALALIIEVLWTKPDLCRWFFSNRPHPSWAEILLQHGFLDKPPEPVVDENRYWLPRWDAQTYLISVANGVPDVVLSHFELIRTNKHYLSGALEALCAIPMNQADSAVPKLIECLADPNLAFSIARQSYELMKRLAEAGFTDSAFALFEKLTAPQPSPRAKKSEAEILEDYFFNAESISFLEIDSYRESKHWKPGLEELAKLDLKRLVRLLEQQLIKALRVEAETNGWSDEREGYSFWRRAIEDTGQDLERSYKHLLLKWLRKNLEMLAEIKPDEVTEIVDDYLGRKYEILKRLGMYLLWRFPQQFPNQVRDTLIDPDNMDESRIHHEYFMLLEHGYPVLNTTDKHRLEGLILSGPLPEKLAEVASWAEKDRGEDPEKYAQGYAKDWRHKRLWMIRNHLQGDAAIELQKLTAELGAPDHPSFTSWFSGVHSVSKVSPVADDEISSMPIDALLKYLAEWKPIDRMQVFERESHNALGEVVARVVFSNYKKYSSHLISIARLNSAYATSLINHLSNESISSDEMLRIKLSLSEELLADDAIRTDHRHNSEGGWIGFRFAIVRYLAKFFDKDAPLISAVELPRVRDLLIRLTDDPDPSPDADQPSEGWFGHEDPMTVALNHVRPDALSTLIRYANYKAHVDTPNDHRGTGPKRLETVVEQTFTRKVNFRLDKSTALHSIYGQWFNWLCWLDLDWATDHLDAVFPDGDDELSVRFFVTAWDSFVIANPVYTKVFTLLKDKYERALELHKQGYNTKTHLDPVGRFAVHLAVEYILADYDLNSPQGQSSLLARFFNETSPKSRATAAYSAIEVFVEASKEGDDRFWRRIRALWQWRLEEAASRNHPSDFDGEMQAFSGLLISAGKRESAISFWSLIEGMLNYIARSEHRDIVWWNFEKYLMLEIERNPVKAIQIFRMMHDKSEVPHFYYSEEAHEIIEIGAQHVESRHETLLLIEQIAKSGNYSFKQIYDQYV